MHRNSEEQENILDNKFSLSMQPGQRLQEIVNNLIWSVQKIINKVRKVAHTLISLNTLPTSSNQNKF